MELFLGKGVMEIKCSFSCRHKFLMKLSRTGNFVWKKAHAFLHKHDHLYYFQMQYCARQKFVILLCGEKMVL